MTVRARRTPVDLAPVLEAVTNDWEPGKVIAQRAGIDPKTAGPRLAALERQGEVEYQQDAELDVWVYRRKRNLPATVGLTITDESGEMVPIVDVEMTETQWTPLGDMAYEQWELAGAQLQKMGRAWQFWCGDWLNYGEARYGEKYTQAISTTDFAKQTLLNVASISKRVPPERRRGALSFSHHEAVAALPPAEQDRFLDEAERDGLTVKRLRSRIGGTPADAPDPESQLAATHKGTVMFKLTAESKDDAHKRVQEIVAYLERRGFRVTYKTTAAL